MFCFVEGRLGSSLPHIILADSSVDSTQAHDEKRCLRPQCYFAFDADFKNMAGKDLTIEENRLEFLVQCSAALYPVRCIEAKSGSIIVTMKGTTQELEYTKMRMEHLNGIHLQPYGVLHLKNSETSAGPSASAKTSRPINPTYSEISTPLPKLANSFRITQQHQAYTVPSSVSHTPKAKVYKVPPTHNQAHPVILVPRVFPQQAPLQQVSPVLQQQVPLFPQQVPPQQASPSETSYTLPIQESIVGQTAPRQFRLDPNAPVRRTATPQTPNLEY